MDGCEREEMWEKEEKEMRDDPAEECARYDINTFSFRQKFRKIW